MQASKNLVLQVFVNKPNNRFLYNKNLFNFSISQSKEYASRFSADYFIHQGPRYLPQEEICFEKFVVWDKQFSQYDKIFYVDMDAIITSKCENIFQYNNFCARPESKEKNSKTLEKRFINNKSHQYFNSGVMLFTKSFLDKTRSRHLEIIDEMKPIYNKANEKMYDQMLFNQIVSEVTTNYTQLENKWNFVPKKYRQPKENELEGKNIVHFIQTRKEFFNEQQFV